jgi:hypothetical protein
MPKIEYVIGKSRPIYLCRWWLKMRECKRATLIGNPQPGVLPVQEFYVPWWAWPLELLHRIIFGRAKLEAIEASKNE